MTKFIELTVKDGTSTTYNVDKIIRVYEDIATGSVYVYLEEGDAVHTIIVNESYKEVKRKLGLNT
jgi:hypothetical protein